MQLLGKALGGQMDEWMEDGQMDGQIYDGCINGWMPLLTLRKLTPDLNQAQYYPRKDQQETAYSFLKE